MLEEGSILFTSELHRNSRIQNYIDNGDFDSQKMLALLEGAPSIDEKYLAMIIQKAIKSVTLSNLGNIRSLLLQIITIPQYKLTKLVQLLNSVDI